MDSLLADLSASGINDLNGRDDEALAQAIIDGGYGAQRIASHLVVNRSGETLPLNRSFLLFGQRYVVDSHVMSNVVFDRVVPESDEPKRMMPDPLDVAYAALGNDQAAVLLEDELDTYGYAPQLESMRTLVDAHGEAYWESNLYTMWMSSLRGVSPQHALNEPATANSLPAVTQTEAWGRRLLSTQLASWAELRHDTLLYAKQSYTGGVSCEFPDAYVDPYPQAWRALERFAIRGQELVTGLSVPSDARGAVDRTLDYFMQLESIVGTLREMAELERRGEALKPRHLEFINQAVRLKAGICGGPPTLEGWYARLHYASDTSIEQDPVVADVHTQPTDAAGARVGKVLHVGTGLPRLMVTTFDTCNGPRAYAGLASRYLEHTTTEFERLDDESWQEMLDSEPVPEVPWMRDLVPARDAPIEASERGASSF